MLIATSPSDCRGTIHRAVDRSPKSIQALTPC